MRKSAIFLMIVLVAVSSPLVARDLNEILKSGYITFGVRIAPVIYMTDTSTGKTSGFCWELASAFARSLGVEARFKVIPTFADYWTKDGLIPPGVATDPAVKYVPDVYRDIDAAAEIFSVLPYREKLIRLVPYIEDTFIIVAVRDSTIRDFGDLVGRKMFGVTGMAEVETLRRVFMEKGLPTAYTAADIVPDERGANQLVYRAKPPAGLSDAIEVALLPQDIKITPYVGYELIFTRQVDFSVTSSFSFFIYTMTNKSLRDATRACFPVTGNIDRIAFGLPHESPALAARLDGYFENAKRSGEFDLIMKKYMGVGYAEYRGIIGISR